MTEQIKILNEAEDIAAYISQQYNQDEGVVLMDRITTVNGYLGRLPKLLADAKYLLNYAKAKAGDEFKGDLSPTKIKMIIESKTINEQKIYDFIERLNSNLVHYHDGLRTQLSFLKSLNEQ